ncbi:MAG: DUF5320 domain-containing protein [Candidatus Aureabacteria bacterium]|nr:DUF5320 domain-containing protein [Candidatus Auribacterota bacterium]
MPFGDRTGPDGMGPMTGRAAGYCAGYAVPGYMNPVYGRGLGYGRGRGRGFFGRGGGRGWRNWHWATGVPGWGRAGYGYPVYAGGVYPYRPELTSKEEMDVLKEQAEALKQELEEIQNHMKTLEQAQEEKK